MLVKRLQERAAAVGDVRPDRGLHQPVGVVQHRNELTESAVQKSERDKSAADACHGYHQRVEDLHHRRHFAKLVLVTLGADLGRRPHSFCCRRRSEDRVSVFVRHAGVQHVKWRQYAVRNGHHEQSARVCIVQRRHRTDRAARPVSPDHPQRHDAKHS